MKEHHPQANARATVDMNKAQWPLQASNAWKEGTVLFNDALNTF